MCICKGSEKRGWGGGDGEQRERKRETLPDAGSITAFLLRAQVETPSPLCSLQDTVVQEAGKLEFGKVKKELTKFNFLLL